MIRFPIFFTMLALLSTLLASCTGQKYESAPYALIQKEGAYEIRKYPDLTLASTAMTNRESGGAFMKLFRFIGGSNKQSEKIAMTTPVFMTGTESGTMSFVLPKTVADQGAPSPSNPEVTVSTKPGGSYAVFTFSGSGRPAPSEIAAHKLMQWVAGQHLETTGTPLFAYYNPPWTPGFLRHNEVLIRLVPGK